MRHTLSDFDFALPAELIAQTPAAERSGSRLLHVAGDMRTDLRFAQLPGLLGPHDLIVFNDTRVIKARVFGEKTTGGRVEMLIERIVGAADAWVQLRASHAPKIGAALRLPGGATATVVERDERLYRLEFEHTGDLLAWLDRYGAVPLPPYINHAASDTDALRYQTVYARNPGAVAAPTAGLHFDDRMLAALEAANIERAYVTLHVGAGTFSPVKQEDLSLHRMHAEWFSIPAATIAAIAIARERGGRVLAVGTTTLRALESAALAPGGLQAASMETSLFVTPGFSFRVVDRLLTNFHLPRSTLLMLVSAFGGYDALRSAYAHAIAHRYRFFSYGDAMLLESAPATARDA